MINKFLIKFSDNDFYYTFKAVCETIGKELPMELTKEQLLLIINNLSFPAYLTYQNKFRYSCTEEDLKHIRNYLKVSKKDLLLNKEVDDYINGVNADNSESFYWNGGSFGCM